MTEQEHFSKYGYAIVRNIISPELAKFIADEFTMVRDVYHHLQNVPVEDTTRFGDRQIKHSFSYYAPLCFEILFPRVTPKCEEILNKKLIPSFSYARILYEGAEMEKHVDRASATISTTITFEIDKDPYDIWITDLEGNDVALKMYPGDMCLFDGGKLVHWRDTYTGKKHIQAQLHFANDEANRYDGRQMLGAPGIKGRQ
jgi:hypothetical protein